jgi:hypothetical protein
LCCGENEAARVLAARAGTPRKRNAHRANKVSAGARLADSGPKRAFYLSERSGGGFLQVREIRADE